MARKSREEGAGIFVPAGLFLGLGFGAFYGDYRSGVLLGLGLGFLGMAIAWVWGKK